MKRYFVLLAIILGMVAPSVSAQTTAPKKKVAVYMTGQDINESYKKVIGAKLVSAITESGEYAAVERTADFLAALSAENNYQTSGEVRDSQIAKLGQKFGVQFVAVADVSEVFNEYFIAARLINVETGLVERACDINGSAESMLQLVALSEQLANDLVKGTHNHSSSVMTNSATNIPKHLSLCVMDRNGKIRYYTAENWKSLSEDEKLDLTKKGVCLIDNGNAFLVGMRERQTTRSEASSFQLPAIWHLKIISKYKKPLDNAMKIFGGDELDNPIWTNSTERREYSYSVEAECYYYDINETRWHDVKNYYTARSVYPLPNND